MTDDKANILVVDDQADNLLILEDLLADRYTVLTAGNGEQALALVASEVALDLVLLDVMMPGVDGFEVCQALKASPRTRDIPVIFLTSLDSPADEEYGLSLGAEDFIHKPFSPPVVLARVRNHLQLSQAQRELRDRNENLERLVAARTREIRLASEALVASKQDVIASQGAIITAFCALAEARDNETGNHILRTQHYVRVLAESLRDHPRFRVFLTEETIQLLFKSAPLHDVGKVAIPDAILLKPGPLTPAEWVVMRRHTEFGRDAIAQALGAMGDQAGGFLRHAMDIAYGHHERWDGAGYPQGLAGDAIPISARLMAVADVYDALISRRVYKDPIPHDEAVAMMAAEVGSHFDPDVIGAMVAVAAQFKAIAESYRDEGPGLCL